MLKSLELIGFKSFADKTRFDFDAGITGVVGPNGSGKSNVVDAIRWILGEQSAKSLRGSEMADVIFNGAATRRSLGMAEVSLILDNRNGFLPIESDEVVVTRRVYRSGEGEYLINGQMARLKDIKELFLGTGASTYSIIEQGKVELLLQSSTKDRRQVFEEAAGISRFKSKKIESLRRLDRVEQNLIRIQDIHDEVDKQLRSLRAQAGKAKKYKEYDDELKQARLTLGLADFYDANQQLKTLDERVVTNQATVQKAELQLQAQEQQYQAIDETLSAQEESVRQVVSALSEIRQQISAAEAQVAVERRRDEELSAEAEQERARFQAVRQRVHSLSAQLRQTQSRLAEDQQAQQTLRKRHAQQERELQSVTGELESLRETLAAEQQLAKGRFQELAKLEHEQAGLESQLQFHWQQHERLSEREKELTHLINSLWLEYNRLSQQEQACVTQARRFHSHASALHHRHEELLKQHRELTSKLAATRDKRTGIASRIDILDNLRQRHEGLAGGVRAALDRHAAGEEVWKPVMGVLAELLQTSAEYADLVELALGPLSEALVVPNQEALTNELLEAARTLPGRVQFVVLAEKDPDRLVVESDDSTYPVLSSLIDCEEAFQAVVDRLLGNTFVVDTYSNAVKLVKRASRIRLVTRDGEVIGPEGTVGAGPKRSSSGILSRGAELRDLQAELSTVDQKVAEQETHLASAEADIAKLQDRVSWHELRQSTLADQRRHFEAVIGKIRQRKENLESELKTTQHERQRTVDDIAEVDRQYLEVTKRLELLHQQIKQITDRSKQLETSVKEREAVRGELEKKVQANKVEAAILEERLSSLQAQQGKLESDLAQRTQESDQCIKQIKAADGRREALQLSLLRAAGTLAHLHYEKQQLSRDADYDPAHLERLRNQRKELSAQVTQLRKQLDEVRASLHQDELRITQLRMQRDGVVERMREDYKIEIGEHLSDEYVLPDEQEREEYREKIKDLREKIGRLGTVNIQAVEQLDELELRVGTLKYQIDDLVSAKKHLENVIGKINEESRRLFLDTFETVRQHFQEVFRKLFGGGKADLILEDETDVLETGIEVIARPPGKEPRSISLLSGGEKSLTAVALLMAIFRSRPSPFCILDEVDAALDESNIGRYVGVLREFLDRSQFILVTHSKVTMAAADMLHGVTQRESGVSIRVSVRLEDVTEDGHIIEHDEAEQPQTADEE